MDQKDTDIPKDLVHDASTLLMLTKVKENDFKVAAATKTGLHNTVYGEHNELLDNREYGKNLYQTTYPRPNSRHSNYDSSQNIDKDKGNKTKKKDILDNKLQDGSDFKEKLGPSPNGGHLKIGMEFASDTTVVKKNVEQMNEIEETNTVKIRESQTRQNTLQLNNHKIETISHEAQANEKEEDVKSSKKNLDVTEYNDVEDASDQNPTSPNPKRKFSPSKFESGEEKFWPVSGSYIVHPDAGTITCICGFNEDDGFTIQCDHCNRWQHAICFNMSHIEDVPDRFICSVCQPREVDTKLARQIQKKHFSKFKDSTNYEEKEPSIQSTKRRKLSSSLGVIDSAAIKNDKISQSAENDTTSSQNNNHRENGTPPGNKLLKRKEHLLTAKEAYHAIFIGTAKLAYKDPLVELFLKRHSEDVFLLTYDEYQFKDMPIEVKPYSDLTYSRIFPGFDKLGVFTRISVPTGAYICELLGELDFKSNYLHDSTNRYKILGVPQKNVVFHKEWPLVIDQRSIGNDTRYLRRSCTPNVELATLRFPNGVIKFVYQALRDIGEGEELHFEWQWAINHPILKLIDGSASFEELLEEEKAVLLESIDGILSFCDCACGNGNKVCHFIKIKKLINTLCKNVKSKVSVRYKLNEIISQLNSSTKKREPPILDRFIQQTHTLQDLNVNDLIYRGDDCKSTEALPKQNIRSLKDNTQIGTFDTLKVAILSHQSHVGKLTDNIPKIENHIPIDNLDEKNVSDLSSLPIPVPLCIDAVDLHDETPHRALSVSTSRTNSGTYIPSTMPESEAYTTSEKGKKASFRVGLQLNHQEISISKTDNSIEEQSRSKKKLSFADYRKNKTNK